MSSYSAVLASSIEECMRLLGMDKKARLRDRLGDPALLLTGFAIGAGAMYIFDPEAGAGRRAAVSQTVVRGSSAGKRLGTKAAEAARGAWGLVARKPRSKETISTD